MQENLFKIGMTSSGIEVYQPFTQSFFTSLGPKGQVEVLAMCEHLSIRFYRKGEFERLAFVANVSQSIRAVDAELFEKAKAELNIKNSLDLIRLGKTLVSKEFAD